MKRISKIIPIGHALKKSLKKGYSFKTFKNDAIAGLVVSLVALPLAMAFSIAVGLPPQHGLYTSIVAGMMVPLLGGSKFQVTGATAAFVIIVSSIVSEHGLHGLMIAEIMAGFFLIAMGIAKLGKYINYVPYPVTMGFTSGIAILIATLAISDFLGLGIPASSGDILHKLGLITSHIQDAKWQEILVGIFTLIAILRSDRFIPFIPSPIVGIGFGILINVFLHSKGFSAETIGDRFSYPLPNGEIGHGIAAILPTIHFPTSDINALLAWPSYQEIKGLFIPSLVITGLCALQTLLSATVADSVTGTKHNPNAELLAIGTGNILSGMVAGLPASGAIARTETNIYSGAKTPFASVVHAILILIYVLLLAPYMSYIPMASLAALLIVVAYRMSHWQQFVHIIQIAHRNDTMVLLTCFGFTVFVDMVAGVMVGFVLACFLLFKRFSDLTQSEISHASTGHHHKTKHLKLPNDVMVYHINGSIFFGTVERVFDHIISFDDHIKTMIIEMEDVSLIDMTGLIAMKTMILDAQNKNMAVILCGSHEMTSRIIQELPLSAKHKLEVAKTIDKAAAIITSAKHKKQVQATAMVS